ncbi:hypothetical protein Pint_22797 [Pistacia integerrima]|uniref:Uncharacterized protein n=1 Tax=Pistacia integerrima TaxID=434235 RepID=A0ACC0YMD5_9ROSI|nr:hypothetical protein Pint_22797 [Pistacia integerrima]
MSMLFSLPIPIRHHPPVQNKTKQINQSLKRIDKKYIIQNLRLSGQFM